jgi:hypothetical protein
MAVSAINSVILISPLAVITVTTWITSGARGKQVNCAVRRRSKSMDQKRNGLWEMADITK